MMEKDRAANRRSDAPAERRSLRRYLPLGVVAAALVIFFVSGLDQYFSLDMLRDNRLALIDFAAENRALAVLLLIILYTTVVAISFPGASALTLFSGFLFGPLVGGSAVLVGATIGATLIFLTARRAAGDIIETRGGAGLRRMEAGFRDNALTYLFIIRLIPLFPFWLVNLAAGFFQMKTRDYVLATAIGIIPGTFVYAGLGDGIGAALESGAAIDMGIIFEPRILLPLLGLSALSTLPMIYKKRRDRAAQGPEGD